MAAKTAKKPEPSPIAGIELAVSVLRGLLDDAATTIDRYERAIRPVRARFNARIRRHAGEILAAKEAVLRLVGEHPGAFERPKTRVAHGIRFGLRKSPDRWAWPDDDALVAIIREHCTQAQQDAYLVTTTVGRKDAIPAEERARLGVSCTPGASAPVCDELSTGTAAALLDLLSSLPEESVSAIAADPRKTINPH